jgi:hypothetical protein
MAEQQFVIRLGVDSSGVRTGISAATSQFDKLAKVALGVVSLGGIERVFQKVLDKASKIGELSKKFGASTDFIQENAFAAQQTSASIEDLEASYRSLQKAQVEALGGNEDLVSSFARANISVEQLRKMRPEELFRAMSVNLAKLPPSAQLTADAMATMGKSGVTMLGAFRDGFAEVAAGAKDAGQVIDKEVVASLKQTQDNITALGNKMIVALAPGIAKMTEWAQTFFDFVKQSAGFVGSTAGALVGGASFSDSLKIAADRMKEEAKQQADEASRGTPTPSASTDASSVESKEEKEKKTKKKREIKENADAVVDAVDSQARRGVFVGGRGGEIARVPVQTLEETRAMNRRMDRLIEIQKEALRTGNPMLAELRKINSALTEETT